MLKVVLDTNQFVSSLIAPEGNSARILAFWRERGFILVISEKIIKEIVRVLRYPHISKKYKIGEDNVLDFIRLIEHEAVVLTDEIKLDVVKDDPDDNKIIACALQAEADYIISGDKHLLKLGSYGKIPIIIAGEFLRIAGRSR